MDYVWEAKRHVDFVMALMRMVERARPVHLSADVTDNHIQTFTDIYANGLDDPQREEVNEHITAEIEKLSAVYLRISANLLFFGNVSGAPK